VIVGLQSTREGLATWIAAPAPNSVPVHRSGPVVEWVVGGSRGSNCKSDRKTRESVVGGRIKDGRQAFFLEAKTRTRGETTVVG
jgi:hypothetical protein